MRALSDSSDPTLRLLLDEAEALADGAGSSHRRRRRLESVMPKDGVAAVVRLSVPADTVPVTVLVAAGDLDVDVLTRVELQPPGVDGTQDEATNVVGQRLDGRDARLERLQRYPAAQHLLVEVDQLDLEVGLGMGAAQQRPALLQLVVV